MNTWHHNKSSLLYNHLYKSKGNFLGYPPPIDPGGKMVTSQNK